MGIGIRERGKLIPIILCNETTHKVFYLETVVEIKCLIEWIIFFPQSQDKRSNTNN